MVKIIKSSLKKILLILLVFTISLFSISGVFALTCDEDYCYIEFTSDDTWVVPDGVTQADILLVGGGGGSAGNTGYSSAGGGGGGAGGLIYEENFTLSSNSYSINIGQGGAGVNSPGVLADNGEDTTAFNLTALGGGGGILTGGGDNTPAADGGSGGGGRQNPQGQALQPTSTWGGFGNDGARNSADAGGGGGGGAGTQPADITGTDGGNGGDGLYFGDIFGNQTGDNGYFAGGGAGGGDAGGGFGIGGLGGGGNGSSARDNIVPTPGKPNTGGGAGGGSSLHPGESGGSGIVLVRFVDNQTPQINIESPELPPIIYKNSKILFNFTVTDNVGVNEIWFEYGGINTTYTNETFVNVLFQGENNLTVYARDLTGNINSQSITFEAETPNKICRNDICTERIIFSQEWRVPENVTNIDIFLVGGGGAGGPGGGPGNNGEDTIFERGVNTFTAQGGQGAVDQNQGGAGGSGGGNRATGTGGSDGSNGSSNGAGDGGVGQGTTTRAFGELSGELFAGGGGGTPGEGGAGGGGSGDAYVTSNGGSRDGTPNTGGGGGAGSGGPGGAGGGAGYTFTQLNLSVTPQNFWNVTIGQGGARNSADSGNGGSGIVIVRYYKESSPIVVSPIENSFLNSSNVLINFTTLDTLPNNRSFFNGTNNITYTQPTSINLSEREHNFTFYLRDTLGDFYIRDIGFEVDLTPPTLDIDNPDNGRYYSPSSLLLVNFSANDENLDSLWYFNGTLNISYNTEQYLNLSNGIYNFTFYANDSAGNIASEKINFFVDDINVSYTITPNNFTKYFNSQDIYLSLNTSSNVDFAGFYLNGNSSNITNLISNDNINWKYNLTLRDRGEYNITFIYTTIQNINFTANTSILVLQDTHRVISKSISNFGTDVYLIELLIENKLPIIQTYNIVDFVSSNFNFGSFSLINDFVENFIFGRILGWENLSGNQSINYSITTSSDNTSLVDNYRIGMG